ncbi:hypothetical protein Tco_0667132 [Tanacetum coccineum]
MKNPWKDPKEKKPTMPREDIKEADIEETTTVGVLEISMIINLEMITEIPKLVKITLSIHQHPKRNSMSPTLKKPRESSWMLKNRRMTLSKTNSSISKPKSSKEKRITKLRFKILKQSLVDSPTNVPPDQLVHSRVIPKPTQKPNPTNDKPYRPPPAENEHVNAIFTRSDKTYEPPVNPNAKTTIIHDDSEDEANEAEKEVEPSSSKQTKSNSPPLKAAKNSIPSTPTQRKDGRTICQVH